MESLLSKDKESRDFYFMVMEVIVEKSDGALSEVVGAYILNYFKTYPAEFLARYKVLDDTMRNQFVQFIAYEYFMLAPESIPEQGVIDFFSMLENHCPDCKPYKTEMKDMKEALLKEIKRQGENE